MKRTIISLLCLFAFYAISTAVSPKSAPAKNSKTAKPVQVAPKAEPVESAIKDIDRLDFRRLIYDVDNKDTVIFQGKEPAIVLYTAGWCPQCRKLEPVYERLAKEYKGRVSFYRVNYDNERQMCISMGIYQIPVLMFFPMQGRPKSLIGYMPYEEFKEIIETNVFAK